MNTETVIKAMEQFCSDKGIRLTTLGQMSVKNRHAYSRLKSGVAQLSTAKNIMDWIDNERRKDAE